MAATSTISSMTGFAEGQGEASGVRWQWEVRAVNGRGLELRVRLATGYDALETEVRKLCQERLARGSVGVSLTVSREGGGTVVRLNEAVLADVVAALARIRDVTGAGPVTAEGVAQVRGVLEVAEPVEAEAVVASRRQAMLTSFAATLDAAVSARHSEGARLAAVLDGHINQVEVLTRAAEASPSRRPERVAERLREQLARISANGPGFDPERLHQEAVMLATKIDIAEEIARLNSHVAAARELMVAGGSVGRKLDFLAQEFNREANTLCSKANDSELTRIGLALKAAIDQWREQVQNVE
jgi:uncharacterized protein (TIGR00255 family)